ncbi:hypothetical protein SDC9_154757 [bioreactor metagenome]|uniref:Uncharacterized protein n=1 Tax=bioreactor metagenome TaxID=1076179 RepID=A0A645EZW9_9ZZZZ
MYIFVILAYVFISLIEIPSLYKGGFRKEAVFFSALMAFSFVISTLLLAGVHLPIPIEIVETIFYGLVAQ